MNSESALTCDRLWQNARLATMASNGTVEDGVLACKNGRIVYAGSRKDALAFAAAEVVDCAGRWITPGLIDCHTHLVHAGNRSHEFELRLAGASYEEIARAGGGIVSTMAATRTASETELVEAALPRLDSLIAEGVTTRDGRLPVNPSGGLKSRGHPIGATGVSQHVMMAMQLSGTAGDMQIPNAQHGAVFNMGGAAVANYLSVLERA